MITILTIICPTIPSRASRFEVLKAKIEGQANKLRAVHPTLGKVEFIYDDSKPFLEGGLSIGSKLNGLLRRATGKYICTLHDDDNIAPNYVETLVRLCHRDADVIAFRNVSKMDNFWMTVDMSMYYPNDQASPSFEIRRQAWNICPVRATFAKSVQYPDSSYGEDFDWMKKVLEYCTTEVKTSAILHEYRHSGEDSEADKIVRQKS